MEDPVAGAPEGCKNLIRGPAPPPTTWSPAPQRGMQKRPHPKKIVRGPRPIPQNDGYQRPVIEASALTTSFKIQSSFSLLFLFSSLLVSFLFSSLLFLFSSLFMSSLPFSSLAPPLPFNSLLFVSSPRLVSCGLDSSRLTTSLSTLLSAPLRSSPVVFSCSFSHATFPSLFFMFVSPSSLL